MKRLMFPILLILFVVSGVSADTSTLLQPWCGSPDIYFSHSNSPDIVGYEGLKIYPDGSNQVDENVTAKNTLGQVLIDSYISSPGLPDVSVIRSGLWRFRTFHYVSIASGITTINFTVIKRSSSGSENLLFSAITDDIDSLVATEYLTSYVYQTDTTMLPTDRLVIKVYAESTHSSNVVTHFLYEGTTNTSHVVSPLLVCPTTTTPSPDSSGSGGAIGAAFGLIAGMIGAIVISKRGIQK
jgi:hypothetical protein